MDKLTSKEGKHVESLGMVRDELVVAIDEAARHLEAYASGPNSESAETNLQACIDGIQQIAGILDLIQLQGANTLAQELFANANEIVAGGNTPQDQKRLELISSSFFILPRYLEYVVQSHRVIPALLIPYINELRKQRSEKALPESFFFSIKTAGTPELPITESYDFAGKPVRQEIRRLRHMYQIGLLGYVRERQIKNSLAMMRRPMLRLQRIGGEHKPLTLLWWLASVTMNVMAEAEMAVSQSRKQLFMRIDRVLRQVETNHDAAFSAPPPAGLIKELVYLMTLSGIGTEEISRIKRAFNVSPLSITDVDLQREAGRLNGPSAHTLSSLVKLLQSEVGGAKKILEQASLTSTKQIDDLDAFVDVLTKVAEILGVVGLVGTGHTLYALIERVKSWSDCQNGIPAEEMDMVASTLLYVESAVSRLENQRHLELSENLTEEDHREVVAKAELSASERMAIEECQSGLLLVKRALNSFIESDYDSGHIKNIPKTLNSVRGAMIMLGKMRAADIILLSIGFVEDVLLDQEPQPAMREILETYADAIIALEYYLNSASEANELNDSVLKFAEESLAALGYQIDGG